SAPPSLHDALPRCVLQVMRESDEIHILRQQPQLDGHQQHDHILAVDKDTGHAQPEQDGAQNQVMRQRDHCSSAFIFTIRRRSCFLTRTCSEGFWYLVSSPLRMVNTIAATIATSRITAATSSGYRYSVYKATPSSRVLPYSRPCRAGAATSSRPKFCGPSTMIICTITAMPIIAATGR